MALLAFLTVAAQIAMLLFVTNAACSRQRDDKRNAMRAGAVTAIAGIVAASFLQFVVPEKHFVAVKEVGQIGFMLACVVVCVAVHLLKRSFDAVDPRAKTDTDNARR